MKLKYCYYCHAVVTKDGGVGDHFPAPLRHGGDVTVPCCESCHNMKDRVSFENWPIEWTPIIIRDMELLSRETRLFLAKITALTFDVLESRRRIKEVMDIEDSIPYGFMKDKDAKIVKCDEEQRVIALLKSLHEKGHTYKEIEQALKEDLDM